MMMQCKELLGPELELWQWMGKRFIIDINGYSKNVFQQSSASVVCDVKTTRFNIGAYKYVTYCSNKIIFNFVDRSCVYGCSVKGFFQLEKTIIHNKNTILIPFDDIIYSFDGNVLINQNNQNKLLEIKEKIIHFSINDNIVNILTENILYRFNTKTQVVKSSNVFGLSFNKQGDLLQTIIQETFGGTKGMSIINTNKITDILKIIRSRGELTYGLKVNGTDKEIVLFTKDKELKTQFDVIPKFEFMNNIYTIPSDGVIKLLDSKLNNILDINFDKVSEDNLTLFMPCGIVVFFDDHVYLLNK